MRLIVADDSVLIRAGVEALAHARPDTEVVASVGTLAELDAAVATAFDQPCDDALVITDIRMPPTYTDEGIVAAERLRESHPWVGVVVLSAHAAPVYLARILAVGGSGRGYLVKDSIAEPGEFRAALETVAHGGSFIDRAVTSRMVDRQARRSTPLALLTARETEILAAVATGRSNAAIGETLFISHRAVEKHINSIFTKLDLVDDRDVNRRVRAVLTFLGVADLGA